jgi:hypothetical protein
MDDFNLSSLQESKNEWCSRLLNILTPHIIEGIKSIFDEAVKLCNDNDEDEKYLMTFQNLISRVPKWNATIIKTESDRICEASNCSYLEDLISCVHIIQLKVLTCVRVGTKQKKIDINIPKLEDFIHNVYIHVARKVYSRVYLYETNINSLIKQRYNNDIDLIIRECIMNAMRDSLPIETILRTYMDETTEVDVDQEIKEEKLKVEDKEANIESEEVKIETKEQEKTESNAVKTESNEVKTESNEEVKTESKEESSDYESMKQSLSFNNTDVHYGDNTTTEGEKVEAPKDPAYLEELNNMRSFGEDDDEDEKLKIFDDEPIKMNDVIDMTQKVEIDKDPILDDIEILG